MAAARSIPCFVFAAVSAFCVPAGAQGFTGGSAGTSAESPPPGAAWLPGGRNYLGLTLGRARHQSFCATTALLCDVADRPSQFVAGTMVGNFWGVEMGYRNSGRTNRHFGEGGSQGLSLSFVGKAQLGKSVGVFGKVGTVYARPEASPFSSSIAAGAATGFGQSYGAGISFAFTPGLSATLEWDSNDFRFANSAREPVRSTSLGLQLRY